MASLPLSDAQRAVLLALRPGRKTTREICAATGIGKGAGGVLQALYQRGLIRYQGGAGVKPGKGWWVLTAHGEKLVGEIAPGTVS